MDLGVNLVVDQNIELGRGRFAIIRHGTLNAEPIAAKTSSNNALLQQEAAFLRRCDHPNIVRFRGIVELNGEIYLMMDFAQYGDLQQRLGAGRFSPAEKRSFVVQISAGLEHIHGHNILHRNLTAENVLLRDWQHVVIAGFGKAEDYVVGRISDHPIVREREYTFRSDVYLLALMAYQILVDRRRVDAELADDIQREFENNGLDPNIFRPNWGRIIQGSLHWRVQERPTAAEFHEAFHHEE